MISSIAGRLSELRVFTAAHPWSFFSNLLSRQSRIETASEDVVPE